MTSNLFWQKEEISRPGLLVGQSLYYANGNLQERTLQVGLWLTLNWAPGPDFRGPLAGENFPLMTIAWIQKKFFSGVQLFGGFFTLAQVTWPILLTKDQNLVKNLKIEGTKRLPGNVVLSLELSSYRHPPDEYLPIRPARTLFPASLCWFPGLPSSTKLLLIITSGR